MKNNSTKFSVYEMVASRVIEQLKKGTIPWRQPWFNVNDGAFSHRDGRCYSLLNQMMLGDDHEYVTWKEIQKEHGKLKKGSRAKQVVFWTIFTKEILDEDGNKKTQTFPILRYYNVYDINDTEGIKPRERKVGKAEEVPEAEKIVNDYISRSGVKLTKTRNSNRAFYSPIMDSITVPCKKQYDETSEYYSTLFHEMTHSTGHKSRLNRITDCAAFGSHEYSKEELVAELGAASLVNYCGLEVPESFNNSVAYLDSWIKALENDSRMIVSAAGQAQKAMDLILNVKNDEKTENDEKTADEPKTDEQTSLVSNPKPAQPKSVEIIPVKSKAEMQRLLKDGKDVVVKIVTNPSWTAIEGVERHVSLHKGNSFALKTQKRNGTFVDSWLFYEDFTLKDGILVYKDSDVTADVYIKNVA